MVFNEFIKNPFPHSHDATTRREGEIETVDQECVDDESMAHVETIC